MIQDKQKFGIRIFGVILCVLVIARLDLLPGQTEPPETRFLGEWNIEPLKTLLEAESDQKIVQQNYAAVGKTLAQFGYQFTKGGHIQFGRGKRYKRIGTYAVANVGETNVRLDLNYTDSRAGTSESCELIYTKQGLVMKRGQHITVLSR